MSAIIGIKKDMTSIYDKNGAIVPCTIVDVSSVKVVGKKVMDKDGYEALVLGYGKKRKPTKAEEAKYKELKYVPQYVVEVRKEKLAEGFDPKVGDDVKTDVLNEGDNVVVTGITKGKGFQGVIKRWRFAGGPRTHGQSDRERHGGSIGAGTDPGRVFKGMKMPGHMGQRRKTILNLKVVKVDAKNKVVCIKGSIPGGRNSLVRIYKK